MPSNDPDIRNEPHLLPSASQPNYDPAIDSPLGFESKPVDFSVSSEEDIDHSVWDEPSLAPEVATKVPDSALTYANWLQQRRESWTQLNSWTVTLGVVAATVPGAVLAGFISWTLGNIFLALDLFVVCLISPMLQEICKIAVPVWIVEKRPYFFTTWFQFFIVGIVTALVFSATSNYVLSLIVHDFTRATFLYQWVGVLGVNLISASIATFGIEKIWRNTITHSRRPRIGDGYPYFATAIGLQILFASGTTIWMMVAGYETLKSL